MKKLMNFLSALALVIMVGAASTLVAQGVGGVIEAAYFRVLNSSGATGWRMKVDGSNNLTFQNADTAHAAIPFREATIGKSSLGFAPAAYTSGQISTLAADASGYMITNITTASPCVSTGTGAGAWVYPSTTSTPSVRATCY